MFPISPLQSKKIEPFEENAREGTDHQDIDVRSGSKLIVVLIIFLLSSLIPFIHFSRCFDTQKYATREHWRMFPDVP